MDQTELELWMNLGRWIETAIKDADREGVYLPELAELAFIVAERLKECDCLF